MDIQREIEAKFKPRARLLIQLGDQLIRNESIALVELVKNSYDADATSVNIYMENPDSEAGVIIIEDDGYGMTAETVVNVWLEPGSDFKSKIIINRDYSPKFHRLPIGEKGIGRFGVHKLGKVIELTTKAKQSNEVYVKINWGDFDKYKYLDEVPILVIERNAPELFKEGKTGTNIVISSLRERWERTVAREVKRSITALVSPFESVDSFKVEFDIVDKPGWFEGLLDWHDVKEYSLFYFKAVISGSSIEKFEYAFTPWPTMTKISPKKIDETDKLASAFKTLKWQAEDEKGKSAFSLNGENLHIGTVIFEGYIFDMDPYILKLGVSDKDGFKRYLRSNGGVRVFRDGLRIYDYGEPENDWLGLDHRRFQNPFKAFSNNQILGAVYLSREESESLVEKTNREGFVENEAYKRFKGAVEHVIDLVETLRVLDKRQLKELYGPTPKSEPVLSILSEAKEFVEVRVKEPEVKKQLIKYLVKIEDDYRKVNETLLKAAGAGLSMSVVVHEVEKIISEISKVLKIEKGSERVLNLVKHLSALVDGYAEIIRRSTKKDENLIKIIEQALFNTEFRLVSHKITIIHNYKQFKGNPVVKTSKNLIIGTLMNLIDNSIFWLNKASELKPGLIQKIFVDLQEDEKFLYLIFADNGTGFLIPTGDITEPFVSAKPGGMGLGLHIASEIMGAQDGALLFPNQGDFVVPKDFISGALLVLSFKK